jgi:hypothetical protein
MDETVCAWQIYISPCVVTCMLTCHQLSLLATTGSRKRGAATTRTDHTWSFRSGPGSSARAFTNRLVGAASCLWERRNVSHYFPGAIRREVATPIMAQYNGTEQDNLKRSHKGHWYVGLDVRNWCRGMIPVMGQSGFFPAKTARRSARRRSWPGETMIVSVTASENEC